MIFKYFLSSLKKGAMGKNSTFKSIRNCKRHNKGNFTSKSNSNKIMLYGGGGHDYLFLNKI